MNLVKTKEHCIFLMCAINIVTTLVSTVVITGLSILMLSTAAACHLRLRHFARRTARGGKTDFGANFDATATAIRHYPYDQTLCTLSSYKLLTSQFCRLTSPQVSL